MRSVWMWICVSALLALVALGFAWRIRQAPTAYSVYLSGRSENLTSQASVTPKGLTLIVGDSIVEQAFHRDLCGAPVFNAGISGAGLRDLAPLARTLSSILEPAWIILAIGTNDAVAGRPVPTAEWTREYERLLAALPADRVELVAIPQVEPGKAGSGAIDLADLAEKNRALQALAAGRGVAFAPSASIETRDGLHPTAAGAAAWRENVERTCPSAPGEGRAGMPS